MRKRTLVLVISGLFLGAAGMAVAHKMPMRAPSATPAKLIPQESAKHLATVKVELLNPDKVPDYGDTETTLTGRITVQQAPNGEVSFQWILPDGVQPVEGETNDSFSDVKAGQTIEVKLVVIGFTKEKQRTIALKSSMDVGGIEMGGSALISSRPDQTWEAVAPQMQKAAEEQLGEESFRSRSH